MASAQRPDDTAAAPVDRDRRSSVSRVVGYAYPWDVIGDPWCAGRVADVGITEVSLAASYHSTRAATPLHPRHRLVEAPQAALYRPVRSAVWGDRALQPLAASWVDSPDPFADAAGTLIANGTAVHAWVVLGHSSRLGTARPDLAVRNCFGDSYSYALCVTHQEVRDHVTTLAVEAVRGVDIAGVSVEGLGQLGPPTTRPTRSPMVYMVRRSADCCPSVVAVVASRVGRPPVGGAPM